MDDTWMPIFAGNANFQLCDDAYLARSRARISSILADNALPQPVDPTPDRPESAAPVSSRLRRWLKWGR